MQHGYNAAVAVNVIITAGGTLPRQLQQPGASPVKALLRVGAETLLERAVSAAAGSSQVGGIAVVGGDDVLRQRPAAAAHVEAGRSALDNVHRGFVHHGAALEQDYFVLSPDLPFLTTAAVDEFLTAARGAAEMAFPLVTLEDFMAHFPGSPNRFELVDGARVTLGSCFYITGRMLKTNIPLFQDFFNSRKQPHKMAVLLGLSTIVAYLRGRLRLEQLERRAAQLTGGVVRAVAVRDASIACDIDNRADYEYALQHARTSTS